MNTAQECTTEQERPIEAGKQNETPEESSETSTTEVREATEEHLGTRGEEISPHAIPSHLDPNKAMRISEALHTRMDGPVFRLFNRGFQVENERLETISLMKKNIEKFFNNGLNADDKKSLKEGVVYYLSDVDGILPPLPIVHEKGIMKLVDDPSVNAYLNGVITLCEINDMKKLLSEGVLKKASKKKATKKVAKKVTKKVTKKAVKKKGKK